MSAFNYKAPNDKDLYNSFLLSYYIGQPSPCKRYFCELVSKGLDRRRIPTDSNLHPELWTWVSSHYDSVKFASKRKYRPEQIIYSNLKQIDYNVRIDDFPRNKAHIIDSLNFNILHELLKIYGYPSFSEYGYSIGALGAVMYDEDIFLLIHHSLGLSKMFDSVMLDGVMSGNMRPDMWAGHMLQANFSKFPSKADSLGLKVWEKRKLTDDEKKLINITRDKYFLEPIDDYIEKYRFTQNRTSRLGMSDTERFHFPTLHLAKI
jgi:hypothetical protein